MRKATFSFLVASALIAPIPAMSQAAPAAEAAKPSTPTLSARAVVAEVRRILAERYVLPERRPALDAILAKGLASGRYDTNDPATLADRVHDDLESVAHDRHLRFSFNPQQAKIIAATQGSTPDPSAYVRETRAMNHGVSGLRVLPGNIRYFDYSELRWIGAESAAALETAVRFLSGGDAVIIDLRRAPGGSPQAVQYLISHFLPAGTPLATFYMNGVPSPDKLSTLPEVPAGRSLIGKPLYVLISNSTGSAAEEFTGHVAGYKLGELVGETTAGAGFRNDFVPIDDRFVLSVSIGRAVLASTGRDWEAVGHRPTIEVPVSSALAVAQAHALKKLADKASGDDRVRLVGIADSLAAATQPRTTALPLSAYTGTYGERVVSLDNGALMFRRGKRAPYRLVPLGGNNFTFEDDPAARIGFLVEGANVTGFEAASVGGPVQGRYMRGR